MVNATITNILRYYVNDMGESGKIYKTAIGSLKYLESHRQLFSYDLLISDELDGELFIYNYTAKTGSFKSMTTSTHIGKLIKKCISYSKKFHMINPKYMIEELKTIQIKKYLEDNINKFVMIPPIMKIIIGYL